MGGAVFVPHVCKVFLAEIPDGAYYRVACGLAQAAEGSGGYCVRKLQKQVYVLLATVARDYALEYLQHAAGAFAAGHALAAAFVLSEVHEKARYFHHAGAVIHYHKAAGTYHSARFFEGIEVQRHIQVVFSKCKAAAGGSAYLYCFELRTAAHAAAYVEYDFP